MNGSRTERRLTDSARTIVQQAPRRAGDRGLLYVDAATYPALLLWTLIRWERKVGLVALETMGVDLEALARDLDEILRQRADEHPVVVDSRTGKPVFERTGEPFSGWNHDEVTQPLFDRAERAARELQHNYVGSEHLLLAIIDSGDPELKRVLDHHLMNTDNVRETILELLRS